MPLGRFYQLVVGIIALASGWALADDASLPGTGWPASRYEVLWTQSPFSVATPEGGAESTAYSLWGIAQIDGVSYASLTDKQSNEHFLLSSDKPARGLTLLSISRGKDESDTLAVIQKDGESITLKLEKEPPPPSVVANGTPVLNSAASPGNPQASTSGPGNVNRVPGTMPPPVLRRPPLVHMPPFPPQQMQRQVPPAPQ